MDEPLQFAVDMGNGLSYQIRGHESDLIWFAINNAVFAMDNVKDNKITGESFKHDGGTAIFSDYPWQRE